MQESSVAFAKPSATIVIARNSSAKPELLLVKRRAGDAFGDSHAFPGGVVDAHDDRAENSGIGVSAEQANTTLDVDNSGLSYFCAGIRELFEETGVLLAKDATGTWKNCSPEIDALRTKVDSGELRWSKFLRQQQLRMAFDALHYFAHWETPFDLPKRWTTRFFAAKLPDGQQACHDGTETIDSCWLHASDALRLGAEGDIKLPYPTIKTLEALSGLQSVEAIFAWTEQQRRDGIEMIRLQTSRS